METGIVLAPWPGKTAKIAQSMEQLGFSTLLLTDSQNLAPEVMTQLVVAAQATKRLRIGTGVTNPVTRDSAVLASAFMSLQSESHGRAVLGIGRGDSAVQRIGKGLHPVPAFREYLAQLQGYLRGQTVVRDSFDSLIEWYHAFDQPKPPVQVAATGPKVIELAAQQADAVMFAVGADPEHLGKALQHARACAAAAGRAPGSVRYGAFINCVMHNDATLARAAVRGAAASFARFSSFAGSPVDRLPPELREAVAHLRQHYDMKVHTRSSSAHARALEDKFVDWFAIAGEPSRVVARFEALQPLGLDFVYLVSSSADTARDVALASYSLMAQHLLPKLNAW